MKINNVFVANNIVYVLLVVHVINEQNGVQLSQSSWNCNCVLTTVSICYKQQIHKIWLFLFYNVKHFIIIFLLHGLKTKTCQKVVWQYFSDTVNKFISSYAYFLEIP